MRTLGQVAFEAAYEDMGENYEWNHIPIEEHGHWNAAAAAVVAEHETRKWQGKDTLPKDGYVIIGHREGEEWIQQFWWCYPQFQPFTEFTHWMPAPDGPRNG